VLHFAPRARPAGRDQAAAARRHPLSARGRPASAGLTAAPVHAGRSSTSGAACASILQTMSSLTAQERSGSRIRRTATSGGSGRLPSSGTSSTDTSPTAAGPRRRRALLARAAPSVVPWWLSSSVSKGGARAGTLAQHVPPQSSPDGSDWGSRLPSPRRGSSVSSAQAWPLAESSSREFGPELNDHRDQQRGRERQADDLPFRQAGDDNCADHVAREHQRGGSH
jgi:hypothetical protein